MAIHKILFASLLICLLIQSIHAATKERLFSDLEKSALEVTATPSRVGEGVGTYISFIHISFLKSSISLGVQDSILLFLRF